MGVALDNSKFPWFAVVGFYTGAMLFVNFSPLPEFVKVPLFIAWGALLIVFFVAAGMSEVGDVYMARQARLHGPRYKAIVVRSERVVWGGGAGGITHYLTLRYDLGPRLIESRRAVEEELWQRYKMDAEVPICVVREDLERWYVVEEK